MFTRPAVAVLALALGGCGGAGVPADGAALSDTGLDAAHSDAATRADAMDTMDAMRGDTAPDAMPDGFTPGDVPADLDATDDAAPEGGACAAVGEPCDAARGCCAGTCSAAAGVCLAGACGAPGEACAAPGACCSGTCAAGTCAALHGGALDDERDRVLETLAGVRGDADRCATWPRLDGIQRGIFLTHSDMLGNRSCMENASVTSGALDGSGNCGGSNACRCAPGADTAFAHVFKLWAVNGSDPGCGCTEGSDGYNCCNGGGEWHRTFFTADDALIDHLRRTAAALPEWGASNDLAGPHAPFTQSSETIQGSPRGQAHFWASDTQAATLTRNGVAGVMEPHIVELDNDYNILHDSNPEGCYGFFGLGCTYGRVTFRQSWTPLGTQAATSLRGNGEPASHAELARDAVYAPRCPTARVTDVAPASPRRGAVLTLRGAGFADCAAHVACGNEVHVRTHSGEVVVGAGSAFDLAESATEIRVQLPAASGTGEAYAWVVVGGVLTNLVPVTITP